MRFSAAFWDALIRRFDHHGPAGFGAAYLLLVPLALALCRDRRHVAVTLAAIVAFLAGWLAFAVPHWKNDYYQLSAATLLFLSFGVSVSRLLSFARARMPTGLHQPAAALLLALLMPTAFLYALTQDSRSDRARARFYAGLEYALRDTQHFLMVTESRINPNPNPAGRVSTKFTPVRPADFEANCEHYIAKHAAIIARGYSECLARHKHLADWFVYDHNGIKSYGSGDITFYLRSRRDGD